MIERLRVRIPAGAAARESFLLQSQLCVLTLIRCPFHPVLPQWHVKDPGHSAKSAGGRFHLNTRTPLIQRSRSGLTMPRAYCGNVSGNELTRNSSGNTRPQSSQPAEPLWTDHHSHQFSPLTDWIIGRRRGTTQQKSFSSLLCGRPS